jgi:hypothetical protein
MSAAFPFFCPAFACRACPLYPVANGETDNGPPGIRKYHARYYAAILIDPSGNRMEAIRSTNWITATGSDMVTFENANP